MTTLTHAVGSQGAQLWGAVVRFLRGVGETLDMLEAAIRVSNAVERRESPDPADLKRLGVQAIPPRL